MLSLAYGWMAYGIFARGLLGNGTPAELGASGVLAALPELQGSVLLGVLALGFVAVFVLPLLRSLARALVPGDSQPRAPWRAVDLAGIVFVGALTLVLAKLTAPYLPGGTEGGEEAVGSGATILVPLLQTLLIFGSVGTAAIVTARRRAGGEGLAALGLARGEEGRSALLGVLSYLAFAPLLWGALALWPFFAERIGIELEPQEVLVDVAALHGVALSVALVLAVPLVPFIEELLFRGLLQSLLTRSLGPGSAVVFTSIVFASLHGASAFGPIFVLSLFLGWLQLRTGRLAASWAAHALHNALTLTLVLVFTETPMP